MVMLPFRLIIPPVLLMQVEGFWLNKYLKSKGDVGRMQTLETVMSYLEDGTIRVKEGAPGPNSHWHCWTLDGGEDHQLLYMEPAVPACQC